MKILILYASHGGATKKCAELLKEGLEKNHAVTLSDVRAEQSLPSPSEFDVCVLGSCIRFARINKQIKEFMRVNAEALSKMPSAFFLCCGFTSESDDYIETQIPSTLTLSLGAHCFGGELKPQNLKGFDKLAVRLMRSSLKSQDFEESDDDHLPIPEILPEAIERLCDNIRKLS
jgi:menaquinone-dependent protoporphyrinogen oxidase